MHCMTGWLVLNYTHHHHQPIQNCVHRGCHPTNLQSVNILNCSISLKSCQCLIHTGFTHIKCHHLDYPKYVVFRPQHCYGEGKCDYLSSHHITQIVALYLLCSVFTSHISVFTSHTATAFSIQFVLLVSECYGMATRQYSTATPQNILSSLLVHVKCYYSLIK